MFSTAGFQDILTINASPFTGLRGYLAIDFTLHGTESAIGGADAAVSVNASTAASCVISNECQIYLFNSAHESTISFSGLFSFPELFPFTYGTPFDLAFALVPVTDSGDSGTATSDFANTLVLSGIHPFGPDMQPVRDATFISASGTRYGPNGVVPEPSSLVLVALALLVLFGATVRRGRSRVGISKIERIRLRCRISGILRQVRRCERA